MMIRPCGPVGLGISTSGQALRGYPAPGQALEIWFIRENALQIQEDLQIIIT